MMTLFHLWDLPGDVLAAPESASGLDRCNLSLSLKLADLAHLQRNNLASKDVIVAHGKLHWPNLGALAYSTA